MGLILLTILSSMVLGALAWLVFGSRLPWGEEDKWPAINNIAFYVVGLLIPVYLVIFTLFSVLG